MKRILINLKLCLTLSVFLAAVRTGWGQSRQDFDVARERMVREVIVGSGISDERVIDAMLATPRHEFVSRQYRKHAYFDMALPIGHQQTISSPFIVAYMTESIDPQPQDKVLEVGTGSGYQAAVLGPLVKDVYTIEIVPSLGARAAKTLKRLRYKNIHTKVGDGYAGWPEHAPFDKIIVTCSPEKVPPALVRQLRTGGRMVIPVGQRYQQTLYLFRKQDGQLRSEALRPTLFVPMTGRAETGRIELPDPLNPRVINGGFEQPVPDNGHIPGWYYMRQAKVVEDKNAPQGKHHVVFDNAVPGRASHALQGFGIDGRHIGRLHVSGWIKTDQVRSGPEKDMLPLLVVTFYDENRRDLGQWWLGPWRNSRDWERVEKSIRVPPAARHGIVRVGLFGAVGRFSIDAITMQAQSR